MFRLRRISILTLLLLGALALAGCSDSTGPGDDAADLARIGAEGDLDPVDGTFVLKTLDLPPPWDGPPIRIQLIGSNLQVGNSAETVSLDVAIRSLHPDPLFAPAAVWVEGFDPAGVSLTNADWVLSPPAKAQSDSFAYFERFGFDYADLLGDGVLDPDETSEFRTWVFHDPGLGSFSFQGWAEFGTAPDLPRLAGRCFIDEDGDGAPQPEEPPLGGAYVLVTLPDGGLADVMPGPDGRWSLPVEQPGFYEVRCELMWMMPVLPCWTTPNPREILLTPEPNGSPQSFDRAHFGYCAPPSHDPPPIVFTDAPPDSLHMAPWTLIDASVEGRRTLRLHVGYSGCEPDHPWTLFAHAGYLESMPLQSNIVLRHELDEDCDAAFDTDLLFDLTPLWEDFLATFGPGELIMNLIGYDGTVTPIPLGVYPEDKPHD